MACVNVSMFFMLLHPDLLVSHPSCAPVASYFLHPDRRGVFVHPDHPVLLPTRTTRNILFFTPGPYNMACVINVSMYVHYVITPGPLLASQNNGGVVFSFTPGPLQSAKRRIYILFCVHFGKGPGVRKQPQSRFVMRH
jgi:hypothetical protein